MRAVRNCQTSYMYIQYRLPWQSSTALFACLPHLVLLHLVYSANFDPSRCLLARDSNLFPRYNFLPLPKIFTVQCSCRTSQQHLWARANNKQNPFFHLACTWSSQTSHVPCSNSSTRAQCSRIYRSICLVYSTNRFEEMIVSSSLDGDALLSVIVSLARTHHRGAWKWRLGFR